MADLKPEQVIVGQRWPPRGNDHAAGPGLGLLVNMIDVRLREIEPADLDLFFQHQQDPEALRMAAFTAADPSDRSAFDDHWSRLLSDDDITKRTIIADSQVVGHVLSFDQDGGTEVTYWVDSAYWSRGIASIALAAFLTEMVTPPLHARAAKDNIGSLTVLRRCGFTITGKDSGYANGRGETVDEYLLTLSRRNSDTPTDVIDHETAIATLRATPVQAVLDTSWVSRQIALYELVPEGPWHRGHTVVIGDAAHALSPAAGRGATSAIEDAIILVKHLRERACCVPEALESFTASRRPIARAAYRPTPGQRTSPSRPTNSI